MNGGTAEGAPAGACAPPLPDALCMHGPPAHARTHAGARSARLHVAAFAHGAATARGPYPRGHPSDDTYERVLRYPNGSERRIRYPLPAAPEPGAPPEDVTDGCWGDTCWVPRAQWMGMFDAAAEGSAGVAPPPAAGVPPPQQRQSAAPSPSPAETEVRRQAAGMVQLPCKGAPCRCRCMLCSFGRAGAHAAAPSTSRPPQPAQQLPASPMELLRYLNSPEYQAAQDQLWQRVRGSYEVRAGAGARLPASRRALQGLTPLQRLASAATAAWVAWRALQGFHIALPAAQVLDGVPWVAPRPLYLLATEQRGGAPSAAAAAAAAARFGGDFAPGQTYTLRTRVARADTGDELSMVLKRRQADGSALIRCSEMKARVVGAGQRLWVGALGGGQRPRLQRALATGGVSERCWPPCLLPAEPCSRSSALALPQDGVVAFESEADAERYGQQLEAEGVAEVRRRCCGLGSAGRVLQRRRGVGRSLSPSALAPNRNPHCLNTQSRWASLAATPTNCSAPPRTARLWWCCCAAASASCPNPTSWPPRCARRAATTPAPPSRSSTDGAAACSAAAADAAP